VALCTYPIAAAGGCASPAVGAADDGQVDPGGGGSVGVGTGDTEGRGDGVGSSDGSGDGIGVGSGRGDGVGNGDGTGSVGSGSGDGTGGASGIGVLTGPAIRRTCVTKAKGVESRRTTPSTIGAKNSVRG
jgi:hypothetical protein